MRERILTVCSMCICVCGLISLAAIVPLTNWATSDDAPDVVSAAAVSVDASDSLTYRPVRALGDDWYLVEIAYPNTYKNPFPFGKTMMVMTVPHLVRMHASELDKLDNPEK